MIIKCSKIVFRGVLLGSCSIVIIVPQCTVHSMKNSCPSLSPGRRRAAWHPWELMGCGGDGSPSGVAALPQREPPTWPQSPACELGLLVLSLKMYSVLLLFYDGNQF